MTEKKEAGKRAKWSKFCPKCGKQTDEFFDSMCKDCFKQGITLLAPESLELSVSVCPHCGGFFKGKEQTSIEPAVETAVRKAIRKKYGPETPVEIVGLSVELAENKRRAHVSLVAVKAEISGVDIEETGEFTAAPKRKICDRCSRIAGGYYAAIVQIRADWRIPTDDELSITETIANSSLGESDFVSKEQVLKEGLDIYVSSADYGRRISRAVVKELGGNFFESKKLYGRKDGREIYRVTFLVRLLGFQQGDVVAIGDKRITVENVVEGKGIEGVDLNTGEPVFVSKKEMMKAKRV
ncbi:MAG TPA: NMD3-related protein [Candidatus Bathyarchaeia archaeon]|nr:NMD3-related protein [Candidatus Bathyarchaeia archaeon]